MKFLKYVYYRIYTWNDKIWGREDLPQYNAMFGVAILLFLNIYTIIQIVLNVIFDSYLAIGKDSLTKMLIVILITALCAICFYYFVKDKKYHKIVAEFQNETKKERKIGTIKIVVYMFVSLFLPIISAVIYNG